MILRPYTRLLALGLTIGLPAAGESGEVNSVTVERNGKTFQLVIEAMIDAPRASIFRSLTDYDNLTALSPAVKESRLLETFDERHHRMTMVTRLCVLLFCSNLRQTQDMLQLTNGDLQATIVAERSNFSSGSALWRLTDQGPTTHLLFTANLAPEIWIPPVIGRALIRHMLQREAQRTVEGLERLYQEGQPAAENSAPG